MSRTICLILAFTICIFFPRCAQAESVDDPNNEEEKIVTIELTKLDVNDTTLELSYKIKNNTDHEVWICDSVSTGSIFNFEVYLDEDAQTLVIRKRLDILPEVVWAAPPKHGRYVRLHTAQEYSESLSLAVPVSPSVVYIAERANAEFASRLVIEIGFYNEDVLERIRSIIEVAERFHCASVEFTDFESDIMRCYFKGLLITKFFGGLSHFDEVYTDTNVNELLIGATYQLIGEQVLRITVDGVSIPYNGNSLSLTRRTGKRTIDEQSQQRSSCNKQKPNREKSSDRNGTDVS